MIDESNYTANIDKVVEVSAGEKVLDKVNSSIMQLQESVASLASGWGVVISPTGIMVGASVTEGSSTGDDFLPQYTQLVTILTNLVANQATLAQWLNDHTHSNGNQGSPTGKPIVKFVLNPYFASQYPIDVIAMKTGV